MIAGSLRLGTRSRRGGRASVWRLRYNCWSPDPDWRKSGRSSVAAVPWQQPSVPKSITTSFPPCNGLARRAVFPHPKNQRLVGQVGRGECAPSTHRPPVLSRARDGSYGHPQWRRDGANRRADPFSIGALRMRSTCSDTCSKRAFPCSARRQCTPLALCAGGHPPRCRPPHSGSMADARPRYPGRLSRQRGRCGYPSSSSPSVHLDRHFSEAEEGQRPVGDV